MSQRFLEKLRSPGFGLIMALLFFGMLVVCLAIDVAKGQLGQPMPMFNSLWVSALMSFICALLWTVVKIFIHVAQSDRIVYVCAIHMKQTTQSAPKPFTVHPKHRGMIYQFTLCVPVESLPAIQDAIERHHTSEGEPERYIPELRAAALKPRTTFSGSSAFIEFKLDTPGAVDTFRYLDSITHAHSGKLKIETIMYSPVEASRL